MAERLQLHSSLSQLTMQALRGTGTKAASNCPHSREKQAFSGIWSSAGKAQREREREATDPFLSRLFPHICEVSAEVVKERLGLFLLEWHISMPH